MKTALLTVAEALACVLGKTSPISPRRLDLLECAGRTLREAITADADSPPFDKALMDGYAVRSFDLRDGCGELEVIEEIAAGTVPQRRIEPGQAGRIMTGAMIPGGADAVVPFEVTETQGRLVRIRTRPVRSGDNLLPRGREMRAGEVLLPPGRVLTPQDLGLLATVGQGKPLVQAPPEVTIFSTGNELVSWNDAPAPGQIRNSNGPMLFAQVVRAGGRPHHGGILIDDRSSLRAGIEVGLTSDVLLLSGGVSAGKFDLVPGVLESLGVTPHFHKVALKPGKPLLFGTRERSGQPPVLVFGLPGNPVSSFVCFELFVRPALTALNGGATANPWRSRQLPLSEGVALRGDRPTFHPAEVIGTAANPQVRLVPWFGSADLRGLGSAEVLAVLPAGEQHLAAGTPIEVLPLGGDR